MVFIWAQEICHFVARLWCSLAISSLWDSMADKRLRETCILIFLLENWFCSWILLHADFSSRNFLHTYFCSSNLLHVDFSLCKTCTSILFLLKLILFLELSCMLVSVLGTCWLLILFMKLVSCWFFSSWNFHIDFYPRDTNFFIMELLAY